MAISSWIGIAYSVAPAAGRARFRPPHCPQPLHRPPESGVGSSRLVGMEVGPEWVLLEGQDGDEGDNRGRDAQRHRERDGPGEGFVEAGLDRQRAWLSAADSCPPTEVKLLVLPPNSAPAALSCSGVAPAAAIALPIESEVRLSRNKVNAIVRPTDVPTWRISVRSLVAVPSRWNGTSFWTMSVKIAIVGPTPNPAISIQMEIAAVRRVSAQEGEQAYADRHRHHSRGQDHLVPARPAYTWPAMIELKINPIRNGKSM